MYFDLDHRQPNVSREDRLIRGCLAVTLLIFAAFGVLGSGHLTLVALGFTLAGAYFAATTWFAHDPAYQRLSIDTRSDEELARAALRPPRPVREPRKTRLTPATQVEALANSKDWGHSLLGR